MSASAKHIKPDGVARPSQLLHTFAPGALVDLPERSVIIGGLDGWRGGDDVDEPRLLARVRALFPQAPGLVLRAPPTALEHDRGDGFVTAWDFPSWYLAPEERPLGGGVARELVHAERRRVWRNSRRQTVGLAQFAPVRFVQACDNGHIADIDWPWFVHAPAGHVCDRPQLFLVERGTSGDFADLSVVCEACRQWRGLADALPGAGGGALGPCGGELPWLGPGVRERCEGANGAPLRSKLLVRHASHAHFPAQLSVIHIPDAHEALERAVGELWQRYLAACGSEAELRFLLKLPEVAAGLAGFDLEQVWATVERRRSGGRGDEVSLKDAEMRTFTQAAFELGDDVPNGTFYARRLDLDPAAHTGAAALLERVVLVHRLQEVSALVGFTRFAAIETTVAGEFDDRVDLQVKLAPLAEVLQFVPATRNNGEGVLITFAGGQIDAWLRRPGVQRRGQALQAAWALHFAQRGVQPAPPWPGLAYVMLHTLSHLLLTALALECGYATSSLKERIYAGRFGYGVLVFTGAPDAEGTLGGLVEVGRSIHRHLDAALDLARLCSNDPICAQHDPTDAGEGRHLLGAACHGCVLISETSCERRNQLLDRSLVVPTLDVDDAAFFA